MLTLGDIMSVDEGRQQRAGMCSVNLLKTFHTLSDTPIADQFKPYFSGKNKLNTYFVTFKFEVSSDTGNKHNVFIRLNPDFDLQYWEGNKVRIACDCNDFKFRCVYLLKDYDSLFTTDRLKIFYAQALSEAPKRNSSVLCKHAFAAVNYLINNYQSIMRSI